MLHHIEHPIAVTFSELSKSNVIPQPATIEGANRISARGIKGPIQRIDCTRCALCEAEIIESKTLSATDK